MKKPPTTIQHPSKHFSSRAGAKIGAIVLHHTAGVDSLAYLTQNARQVSTHSLINKLGVIYRMVPDHLAANTVGFSNLGLYTTAANDKGSANQITYNIELENLGNGIDPYPEAQRDACGYEIARVWFEYGFVPVLTHELIDTQGKNDPHGLDLVDTLRRALVWYDEFAPRRTPYTEMSRIVGAPPNVAPAVIASRIQPTSHYSASEIREIVNSYWATALPVGIDPLLAIAQMCHETGSLSHFWSWPPQHNPAGIGVTGKTSATPKPGYTYNTERKQWEVGISFPNWEESIRAHVGRLLAYATHSMGRTQEQQALINTALSWRSLPQKLHGSAQLLIQLGAAHNQHGESWASPGTDYGAKIAAMANRLAG